jgi:A/G-specific adenine glycosylase
VNHTFTHYKLAIYPQPLRVEHQQLRANEVGKIWLPINDAIGAAIPTPVRNILIALKNNP